MIKEVGQKKKGTIMSVLEIKDLHVEIEGKEILKGVEDMNRQFSKDI